MHAAAALAAACGLVAVGWGSWNVDSTEIVTVAAGSFAYRQSGEFLRDGEPTDAPLITVIFDRPVGIMRRQVSAREYTACVAAGWCRAAQPARASDDRPMVGVSFLDAGDYAAWLSRETGYRYRLPSDAEWAYVAGQKFRDDALALPDGSLNPAIRWLAAYESASAARSAIQSEPRPFGSFGVNENGIQDLAGNVWEWTQTCFTRHATVPYGSATGVESCGVRIAEGNHRAYLSDFVRDPKGGGCSGGAPPANVGLRLVREDSGFAGGLVRTARRIFSFLV